MAKRKKITKKPPVSAPSQAATITKGTWERWSGRPQKTLNAHATRYGIPVGTASIDLAAVAAWIHTHLTELSRRPKVTGPTELGDALEECRRLRAQLLQLDVDKRQGTLVDRERSHQCWSRVAAALQQFGDTLGQQYGASLRRTFNNLLRDCNREVDQMFGSGGNDDPISLDDQRDDSRGIPVDARHGPGPGDPDPEPVGE